MPADWAVEHWPRCDFHAFLSHCAEDRDRLVVPVHEELKAKQLITWLDLHDYPPGRDPKEILREELLRCRHVVFFVTHALLRQGRGWSAVERAYADVIQRCLSAGPLEICHIELPLVFVPRNNSTLGRSVWAPLLPKAVFCPERIRTNRGRAAWALSTIETFIENEQKWGLEIGSRIQVDPQLATRFGAEPHLFDRVIGATPPPFKSD